MIAAISGIMGVIIGAFLTQFLQWGAQRKQWIADHRRGEFRKLLTTLNESYMTMLTENKIRRKFDAEIRVTRIIADRIFISGDIKELDVMQRWLKAARRFEEDRNGVAFSTEVEKLSEDLRNAALATITGNE